ncbi:uncharacterized protein JCM6883_005777 [Sporobolomyces salmoneus]|uniref:uncharacterized protein n=1 Tax=Sporobolomyces salmoneus TaxID=183962 RepID=UPI003171ED7B
MTPPLAARIKRSRGLEKLSLLHFSAWHAVRVHATYYTLWAAVVYFLNLWGLMPGVSSAGSLVGILSMVTGLLVSFRCSTSYDRWYEGRRTWAAIQSTTRNMLRVLVFALPPPSGSPLTNSDDVHSRQSKTVQEVCSLVCAFPFACMYRLRDQSGVSHPELRQLLPEQLLESFRSTPLEARRPSIGSTSSASFVDHSTAAEEERAISGLNAPPSATRFIPFALPTGEPSNLPLSLIRASHAYLNAYHSTPMSTKGQPSETSPAIDAVTYGTCVGYLKDFSDQLTALERIRDTPIPLILNIHLQLLLFVYVAAVPLQLVKSLGWVSIPATTIAASVFFGLDRASEELSDPFGTEPNDLPVARYCADLYREYLEMIGKGGSHANEFQPETLGNEKVKKEQ